jgi:hypothetical protein
MTNGHLDYDCTFCGKPATYKREVTPPDRSTRVYRFFCRVACEAKWGTNQPKPEAANERGA